MLIRDIWSLLSLASSRAVQGLRAATSGAPQTPVYLCAISPCNLSNLEASGKPGILCVGSGLPKHVNWEREIGLQVKAVKLYPFCCLAPVAVEHCFSHTGCSNHTGSQIQGEGAETAHLNISMAGWSGYMYFPPHRCICVSIHTNI